MFALPPAFEEKMKKILKEEYPAFREGYELPRKFGLRINRDKITPEEFEKLAPFELTPIPWVDNGFYYGENDRPSRHPFYYSGLYYLQEPSAMTPANILPVNPGDRVLDLYGARCETSRQRPSGGKRHQRPPGPGSPEKCGGLRHPQLPDSQRSPGQTSGKLPGIF